MMMAGNSSKKLNSVQLGYSVEYEDHEHRMFVGHKLPLWRDWDGGQIGGRPSWLQPRDLPKGPLVCKNCDAPLCFVCQLYAPTDEVNPDSFHRSMYVFGCQSKLCAKETTGSIRVIRAQLPKENPFYPDEQDEAWTQHLPETWDIDLCQLCGQRGTGRCPIQSSHFCGKHHQKEYKKHVFDKTLLSPKGSNVNFLPSVYTESELVVEEEPSGLSSEAESSAAKAKNALFPSKSDKEGDDEDDENLEQADLNEMTGAANSTITEDPVTMAFYERVGIHSGVQQQCLRYMRWPGRDLALEMDIPLWVRSDYQPPESIPECPYCGAERKFEFQIMPQMVHYLLKDHQTQRAHAAVRKSIHTDEAKKAIMTASSIMEQAPSEQVPPAFADAKEKAVKAVKDEIMGCNDLELDWGVIAVYTCTASCGGLEVEEGAELGAYREEFTWKQPSLDS
jgi:pre-rRNA-processing protein TSR4